MNKLMTEEKARKVFSQKEAHEFMLKGGASYKSAAEGDVVDPALSFAAHKVLYNGGILFSAQENATSKSAHRNMEVMDAAKAHDMVKKAEMEIEIRNTALTKASVVR